MSGSVKERSRLGDSGGGDGKGFGEEGRGRGNDQSSREKKRRVQQKTKGGKKMRIFLKEQKKFSVK